MTTTLTYKIRINGTLANVTSVKLANSENTFGVRRTDTGEVIVAAGTDVPNQSAGIYQLSWEDPAPGLEYEVWIVWVSGGATYREQRFIPGTNPAVSAEVINGEISAFLGEAKSFTFTALDADGEPTDLSGKVLEFSVATEGTPTPPNFTRDSGGNGITIGGDGHNEITIALTPAQTAAVGRWHFTLWNATDDLVLADGKFTVKVAAQQA